MGNAVVAVLGIIVLVVASLLCGAWIGAGMKRGESTRGYWIAVAFLIVGAAIIIYAVVQ